MTPGGGFRTCRRVAATHDKGTHDKGTHDAAAGRIGTPEVSSEICHRGDSDSSAAAAMAGREYLRNQGDSTPGKFRRNSEFVSFCKIFLDFIRFLFGLLVLAPG